MLGKGLPKPKLGKVPYLALISLIGLLTVVPTVYLFASSFRNVVTGELTVSYWLSAYLSPVLPKVLFVTSMLALGKAVIALSLGTILALLVHRTNIPFKRAISVVAVTQLFFPEFLNTIAWVFLLAPGTGMINVALKGIFGLKDAPFNIFSLPGLVMVEGLHSVATVFIILSGSLRSMDSSLEDGARCCGSSVGSTFRRVTLPLMKPAILSVALLTIVNGYESFAAPSIIGTPAQLTVFTTEMFKSLQTVTPERGSFEAAYSRATAFAALLLGITLVLLYFYQKTTASANKFVTVTGKSYTARPIDLGRFRYVVGLVPLGITILGLMPIFIIVLTAFKQRYSPYSLEMFGEFTLNPYIALFSGVVEKRSQPLSRMWGNTLTLVSIGPILAAVVGTVIAYTAVRGRVKGRGFLEGMSMLPFAIPGFVFGMAILRLTLTTPLYGTVFLIIIAGSVKFVPYILRLMGPAMIQVGSELEESSRVCGASWLQGFRTVLFPLILYPFALTWVYTFTRFFQELSMVILLGTTGSEVMASEIFILWENGETVTVAALATVYIVISAAVYLTATYVAERWVKFGGAAKPGRS